ncbi:MAG: hypothetical protein ACRDJ9_11045 [Dehalococcoidia bacterium]
MHRFKVAAVVIGVAAAIGLPQVALAAHDSQAMAQHMRLMAAENPGMMRMMQTPMGHMEDAPAFRMPAVHP